MTPSPPQRSIVRKLKEVDGGLLIEFDEELMSLFDEPPTIRESTLAEITLQADGISVRILPELLPAPTT